MVNKDHKRFNQKAAEIAEILQDYSKRRKRFLVFCHFDADGLASGAIIGKSLYRAGASTQIRVIRQVDSNLIKEILTIEHDVTVFVEIGSGYVTQIQEGLRDKEFVIIDHHPIVDEESSITNHINPIMFGYDGSQEISGAGVAYFVAEHLSKENVDLSTLAVVGALGDMQDKNEKRQLKSLNKEIVDDAVKGGFLNIKTDLIFFGRETRPIHKALATTTSPFLPGLSGREDRCLSLFTSLDIPLKDNGDWRTISSLSEEEKRRLITALVEYLSSEGFNVEPVKNIIGEIYTIVNEKEGTFLRDGREYSSTLNACGRMDKGGLGISICLGDRDQALREVEEVLKEYKHTLSQIFEWITQNKEKIQRMEVMDVVRGEQVIEENFTGAISSMLNSSGGFESEKIIVVASKPKDGFVKISARAPRSYVEKNVNLGEVLNLLSQKYSGIGGGHAIAAGAKIPQESLNDFLIETNEMLVKVKG